MAVPVKRRGRPPIDPEVRANDPEVRARYFAKVFIANGGNADEAAMIAGLPAGFPLWTDERVSRATFEALQARLRSLAPLALATLEELLRDAGVPPAIKRLAASDILDRVGLISQTALKLTKPLETLSEMPAKDLRLLVERLETELFSRAQPVPVLGTNSGTSPDVRTNTPDKSKA